MFGVPDFRSYSRSGPFGNKPLFDHWKSILVQISDPHCNHIQPVFTFSHFPWLTPERQREREGQLRSDEWPFSSCNHPRRGLLKKRKRSSVERTEIVSTGKYRHVIAGSWTLGSTSSILVTDFGCGSSTIHQGVASLTVTAKSSWRCHLFFSNGDHDCHRHLKNQMTILVRRRCK